MGKKLEYANIIDEFLGKDVLLEGEGIPYNIIKGLMRALTELGWVSHQLKLIDDE